MKYTTPQKIARISMEQKKKIVPFLRTDWLLWKWSASATHLRAAEEMKSRVNNLISDHSFICWQKKKTNFKTTIPLFFGEYLLNIR